MVTGTNILQAKRQRWNELARALGFALWIFPMAQFWMRFFPPLRPFDFHSAFPPWWGWAAAALCCALPYALPKAWFRPLWFESRKFYENLGVRMFRRAAPDGDLVNRELRNIESGYRLIRNRSDLNRHVTEGLQGERTHLAFLVAGLFTAAYAVRLDEPVSAVLLSLGNIAFNLYPVLLQRYKRVRMRRDYLALR